jgi:UDP-glucose 4-epimerase
MIFKNVAVVGSNGFIGSHLTRKLLQVPDIQLSLFGKNEHCVLGPDLPYHQIDITDKQQVLDNFAGVDLVYYLASGSIPFSTWEKPSLEVEKNLLPFLSFMETIASLKVKKVVFTSSAGTIYGTTDQKATEDFFKNPYSPHGIIKLTMEYFLNYFRVKYGLESDVYRIANCYGPGQNTGKGLGLINTFIEKILTESRINIFGDGKAIRNYIYASDLAELMACSLVQQDSGIYNASSNDHLNINEIIEVMKEIVTEPFEVIYTEKRQSDNPAIYLDNSRILAAHPGLKFTSIRDGIRSTYEHIKSGASV